MFVLARFLVTLRFTPAFDLAKAKLSGPIVCAHRARHGVGATMRSPMRSWTIPRGGRGLEDRADELGTRSFRSDPAAAQPVDRPRSSSRSSVSVTDAVQLRRHAVPMRPLIDRLADDSELVTAPLVPYLRASPITCSARSSSLDGVREILTTVVDIRMRSRPTNSTR